jgi:hypothetical protein
MSLMKTEYVTKMRRQKNWLKDERGLDYYAGPHGGRVPSEWRFQVGPGGVLVPLRHAFLVLEAAMVQRREELALPPEVYGTHWCDFADWTFPEDKGDGVPDRPGILETRNLSSMSEAESADLVAKIESDLTFRSNSYSRFHSGGPKHREDCMFYVGWSKYRTDKGILWSHPTIGDRRLIPSVEAYGMFGAYEQFREEELARMRWHPWDEGDPPTIRDWTPIEFERAMARYAGEFWSEEFVVQVTGKTTDGLEES